MRNHVIKLSSLDEDTILTILNVLNTMNNSDKSIILTYSHCLHEPGDVYAYIFKCLGLILSDGNVSALLKGYKTINFRCITKYTAYAVIRSFIPLCPYIRVRIQGYSITNDYFSISVLSRGSFAKKRNMLLKLLRSLVEEPLSTLTKLKLHYLSALFAGLIDGDGYIGRKKGYHAISYARDGVKGNAIETILTFLSNKGFIKCNKYRGKPQYERTFRFTDFEFVKSCLEYVYHPKRRSRLLEYVRNYIKNYMCGFTLKELELILTAASSAFIDQRKSPRHSRILVIYIDKEDFNRIKYIWKEHSNSLQNIKPKPIMVKNRVMIKIAEKCKNELRKAIEQCSDKIDEKVLHKIRQYLTSNMTS